MGDGSIGTDSSFYLFLDAINEEKEI